MSDNKKNYKDTLNLPKTSFDMRAGLVKKEPVLQQKWRDEKLYEQIRQARQDSPRFVLHDGPPFANGNIHMGTTLNKVLKDIVVRLKTMQGMDCPYVPGWDCHGQPIEQKIVEELGEDMENLSALEIRRRCQAYAEEFQKLQSEQFQKLGVIGEFDDPYITMSPGYEASVLEVFAQLVEEGVVHRQLKPVHWSIANRTALAEAELEYYDRKDTSIYVGFRVVKGGQNLPHGTGENLQLMIWTTTPWTLPANRAVAVHPNLQYAALALETADGPVTYIVAAERVETLLAAIEKARPGWVKSHEIAGEIVGDDLIAASVAYEHPVDPDVAPCPVLGADYVTLEDGTGLVHTAPGHGMEDYGTGLRNGLEIYCPVRGDGTFDDTVPDWLTGATVWNGNEKVIEHLQARQTLVMQESITHSYPHDWRSKTPTIFRATEQWFVMVDRPLTSWTRSLREMALEACRRDSDDGGIDFIPNWGRNRMAGMLESRPDWCLSRQRSWGLPIPAFYNEDDRPLLTPASVRAVAKVVQEQGSDCWFKLSPGELLAGYDPDEDPDLDEPGKFPIERLRVGQDILDVWFESGSSWHAVAIRRGLSDEIPVDMYLEGSDQHRGWFQLSMLPALGAKGRPPFQTLLTHGFVVDEDGRKMSKSVGNTIDAVEQLSRRGADILRLWVASQNYQDDVRCSEKLIAQAEDAYRKIRNTLRFCMGACGDFDPQTHATDAPDYSVDLWMRLELHQLIRDVLAAYDRYEFHRAMRLIYEFCTVEASSIYLSAVKDRLYCETPDAIRRRASQTVIHEMLVALVKLLAPILPHTADEAWEHIPNRPSGEPESVHLATMPVYDEEQLELAEDLRPVNPDIAAFSMDKLQGGPAAVWDYLLELRSQGLIKLEKLRNEGVKNPLDAEAVFTVAKERDDVRKFLELYLKELEDLLGVGYARIETGQPPEDLTVGVDVLDSREEYDRCARSWKRRPDVGKDEEYPDLCVRDAAVMRELSD